MATTPETTNISDFLLENARFEDVAVVEAGKTHSYGDLFDAAAVLARHLRDLELPPGSRISILGNNSLFWVAAYLATLKLGHVAVPLATNSTPDDLRRNGDWVGCRVVFLPRRDLRRYGSVFTSDTVLVSDELLALGGERYWPTASPSKPDNDAVLMFTSGTTAGPKVVRITHANIMANTQSILDYLDLRRDDRMLVILPFFYCYGASLLHTHLRAGASLALCNTFTFPETAIDMMRRENCTGIAGVPSSYQLLLRASTFASSPLPDLRMMQQAGGKLASVLVRELVRAQPQARLFVMYGQTEATARLSYLPPELALERLGSIGKGIPGVTLRVLDADHQPVQPGQTGEIHARGDNISPGYLHDPEASARKFVAGELRTGDLATVDEDGFIYVVDRKADFIKSWGYRISSQEIEACALSMPELVSAAAVGVPDVEAGEAIALFVTMRPGAEVTADEIATYCRRHLAKHMAPQTVRIVPALPLTSNGKVAKRQLKQMLPGYISDESVQGSGDKERRCPSGR